VIQLIVVQTDC